MVLGKLSLMTGFETGEETAHYSTAFGTLVLLKAVKPKASETGEGQSTCGRT